MGASAHAEGPGRAVSRDRGTSVCIAPGGTAFLSTGDVLVPRSSWLLGFEGSSDPDVNATTGLFFITGITVTWHPSDSPDDIWEDSELEPWPEPSTMVLVGTGIMTLAAARLRRKRM